VATAKEKVSANEHTAKEESADQDVSSKTEKVQTTMRLCKSVCARARVQSSSQVFCARMQTSA